MAESPQEALLGKLAVSAGLISQDALDNCRAELASASGPDRPTLAQLLVTRGYATQSQLVSLAKKAASELKRREAGGEPATDGDAQRPPGTPTTSGKGGDLRPPSISQSASPIEGYEILSKLGQGAMGAVYKARQISMDRVVALKVLPPKLAKNKQYIDRFMREARAAARLNHENIVGAFDIGESSGLYYFAMEYVEGTTVKDMLTEQRTLGERQSLEVVRQIALALTHASRQGIVHRDIKPDNIMIARDGLAKLCDMGLAKQIAGDAAITMHGAAVGTPWYISPEQARGQRDVDTRCDIYSLGCTLYHMLCGGPPYIGPTAAVIMTRHINDPVPDPRRSRPRLSEGVAQLTMRMMAKEASDRYQSPEELIEDIDAALEGRPLAAPPEPAHAAPPERADRGRPPSMAGRPSSRVGSHRSARAGLRPPSSYSGRPQSSLRPPGSSGAGRPVSGVRLSSGVKPPSGGNLRPKSGSSISSRRLSRAAGGRRRDGMDRSGPPVLLIVIVVLIIVVVGTVATILIANSGTPADTDSNGDSPETGTGTGLNGTGNDDPDTNGADPSVPTPDQMTREQRRAVAYAGRLLDDARVAADAGRTGDAVAILDQILADPLLLPIRPDLVEAATEERGRLVAIGDVEAREVLAGIQGGIERDGLLDGDAPDFREALRRLDAFPAELAYTDVAGTELEMARAGVRRDAHDWLTRTFTVALSAICEVGEHDRARRELREAESRLPDGFASEIATLDRLIDVSEENANAALRAENTRLLREYEAWFAEQLEPMLVDRLYMQAIGEVMNRRNSLDRPVAGLDERIHDDLALFTRLQAVVQSALTRLKRAVAEGNPITMGGGDLRILACQPVDDTRLDAIDSPDHTVRFQSGDRWRDSRFSQLRAEDLWALAEPVLHLALRTPLDRYRAHAAFVAWADRFRGVARRASALLRNVHAGRLHPRVVEGLHEQVTSAIRRRLERLDSDYRDWQGESNPDLKQRLGQQLRNDYATLIDSYPDSRWFTGGNGRNARALESRMVELVGGATHGQLARLFTGEVGARGGHRAAVRYHFSEARAARDFELVDGEGRLVPADDGVTIETVSGRDGGSGVARLRWKAPIEGDFSFSTVITPGEAWGVLVTLCDTNMPTHQYTLPLVADAPLRSFHHMVREAASTVHRLMPGLYRGSWGLLRFPDLVRQPGNVPVREPDANANPVDLAGDPGAAVVAGPGQPVRLAVTRTAGTWTVEIGDVTLTARDTAVPGGWITITVVNGSATLHEMRYSGALRADWLDDALD